MRRTHSSAWYSIAVFGTIALTMLSATVAQARTWYLMAPEESIVSEPQVATRMARGRVMGPFELKSLGKFSSRAQCEPERQKLVMEWTKRSVIARGSWGRYGFTSPSAFVRCVASDDPMLKKSPAGEPSMETFINRPRFH
jgi:hypothetical protein